MGFCYVCSTETENGTHYCDSCYKLVKSNLDYFRKIKNEWKLEAKEEDKKYFYFPEETKEILSGKKSLVIGRKGAGKTAMAQYICNLSSSNIFHDKMTFKDFPFNILYQHSNSQYTRPNQFITIWKYLIYTSICKQMISNEGINANIVELLKKLFPSEDNNKKLQRLVEKYTLKEFGLQLLSCGINVAIGNQKPDASWIEYVEALEEIIKNNIDSCKYFVIFDELDEDYKVFDKNNLKERNDYFDLITGLFKAVQDVRTLFHEIGAKVYPVVFLRSDIYNSINYSDKNKWSDSLIKLEWTNDKLKALITHRINTLFGSRNETFEACWKRLFATGEIKGDPEKYPILLKQNVKKSFDDLLKKTQNRPRDLIKYIKECSTQALNDGVILFRPYLIRKAEKPYSDYLKQEITDEIYTILPEIDEVFGILSLIRKSPFVYAEFVEGYNQIVAEGSKINIGADKALKLMFEYSIIGNIPPRYGHPLFKYESDSAIYNVNEQMIIHYGLKKALNIK